MTMTTTQYNSIMTELRSQREDIKSLDAKTDSQREDTKRLWEAVKSLREETRQDISELRKSHRSTTRWALGLFVTVLLINGPAINFFMAKVM